MKMSLSICLKRWTVTKDMVKMCENGASLSYFVYCISLLIRVETARDKVFQKAWSWMTLRKELWLQESQMTQLLQGVACKQVRGKPVNIETYMLFLPQFRKVQPVSVDKGFEENIEICLFWVASTCSRGWDCCSHYTPRPPQQKWSVEHTEGPGAIW